ncbi:MULTISPECIES: MgtC/SapB family protein [Paraburkholderia]|uniref:Protein MgtC n=1 Tax=Paraburkholderia acidicola TaxID=1912599 RepID=A0ABV1LYI8_9BURK
MPLLLTWQDIAIRIAVAAAAGALAGFNRGESGKPAGMRTTLLVCLAACIAMLQVNALLQQAGRPHDSFNMLDLMRLPLGILSGVGFIGAGAILHRDRLVTGLTTAATLWFVTVVGLCAGGGQVTLALIALALGLIVLWGLEPLEEKMPRRKRAALTLSYSPLWAGRNALVEQLKRYHCRVVSRGMRNDSSTGLIEEQLDVQWYAPHANEEVERTIAQLVANANPVTAWSISE